MVKSSAGLSHQSATVDSECVVDISLLASMGGLEQTAHHSVGEEGVRRQLGPRLGRVEWDRRWEEMLDSGCRTGVELRLRTV